METSNPRRRIAATFLVALAAACSGDDATGPQVGTLRVLAPTTGGDFDVDGYEIVVSGLEGQTMIFANGAALVRNVSAGTHMVSLTKLAPNCMVSGIHPRSVDVTAGATVEVTFEVVCSATGIVVTTRTTGIDVPLNYEVSVAGVSPRSIGPNDSVFVGHLAPGTYATAIVFPNANCSAAGEHQVTAQVFADSIARVRFDVTCAALTRLERIAFVIDTLRGGVRTRTIALVNADGSGFVSVGAGDFPAWSPDGTRIVYSTTQCGHDFYYYYVSCHGGLVVLDPELRSATSLDEAAHGFTASWAPSGDAIAFSRWRDIGFTPDHLYTVGLDGSPRIERRLGVSALTDPAWSPDGRRIAFACYSGDLLPSLGNPGWDICVADSDGTEYGRLTNDPALELDPAWSPDGTRLAFTRGAEIVVVTVGDNAVTTLTNGRDPAWSRDGSKLVFVGNDGLFTVNADGSNRTRLTTGAHYAPAWRP
ncbi:MAG TPA: hypothetical protein VFZ21_29455 [Gemmatimonadaceae bacterium]|jgi:Tol biopolymer transport system component|nr:hypothetical protein [Gemmatimonadaceae bacterium]